MLEEGEGKAMALLEDDLDPRRPEKGPKKLDSMSIDELAAYIEAMKAEIARAEAEIVRKKDRLAVADSFFRS